MIDCAILWNTNETDSRRIFGRFNGISINLWTIDFYYGTFAKKFRKQFVFFAKMRPNLCVHLNVTLPVWIGAQIQTQSWRHSHTHVFRLDLKKYKKYETLSKWIKNPTFLWIRWKLPQTIVVILKIVVEHGLLHLCSRALNFLIFVLCAKISNARHSNC